MLRSRRPWQRVTMLGGYVRASLALDRELIRCPALPVRVRGMLILSKYRALLRIAAGRQTLMHIGGLRLSASSVSDVGTAQSAVTDVAAMVGSLDLPARSRPRRPVVVDVGANIGQFAAATALLLPSVELVCFEPDPGVHRRLAATLAGTDAQVHCAALADRSGTATLYRHPLSVMSSLVPSSEAQGAVEITVGTLDESVRHPAVDLLKIDVEGAEFDVLNGARQVLGRTRFLLLELSIGRVTNPSNLTVLSYVREVCPDATIVNTGRPLGDPRRPTCQDVLIDLHPTGMSAGV